MYIHVHYMYTCIYTVQLCITFYICMYMYIHLYMNTVVPDSVKPQTVLFQPDWVSSVQPHGFFSEASTYVHVISVVFSCMYSEVLK